MSAATIPFTPSQPARPWTPDQRDRLIFQWVKFEGQTQSWVAAQLEISQSTVSRIIDRYERWIARGGPSQQGAPSHDERLRAQRWLTYERNEWMLASALRLAGEMERILDTSKSVVRRPLSSPSAESEVRTEHRAIDRSGLAARYLRLAYRINMDQLKLVEQEPLPALDPLTIEDLGENAACHGYPADAACHGHPAHEDWTDEASAGCHGHPARADRADEAGPSLDASNSPSELTPTDDYPLNPDDSPPLTSDLRPLTSEPAVSIVELTPNASPVVE
jgi:hypothetical protein